MARLAAALEDRHREVWIDVGGIEDAEVFPAAIRNAIARAGQLRVRDHPDSAPSQYCAQEVDYVRGLQLPHHCDWADGAADDTFSNDGRFVAAVDASERQVAVCSAANGRLITEYHAVSAVNAPSPSAPGTR